MNITINQIAKQKPTFVELIKSIPVAIKSLLIKPSPKLRTVQIETQSYGTSGYGQ
jgi:hypothetical protein